jgi:hypothetical protein
MPFFCNPNFAARRGGAPIQFPISKKLKIGKTMSFFASSISKKLGMQKMTSFSITDLSPSIL